MRINRKTFLILALIVVSAATAASRKIQTSQKPSIAPPPVTIPFELVTRHIVVKVRIDNSRPLSFILDTGDKVGIVDLDRAKELGLKLEGQVRIGGAGANRLTGAFVRGSSWTLVGLDGFSQPIALAVPFGDLAVRSGHDFDGIIGSDFIRQFVVEVDYQASVIRLHNKDKFTYAGPGESIPIQLDGQGHPILEAEATPVGGEPIKGKFVLDLGSSGALALYSPFVAGNRLLSSLKTIRLIGAGGAGGRTNGRVGRISNLKIGKFKIAGPITLFSEDTSGAFANPNLAGNIGQQIAGRFKLFLDYSRERIILEPTSAVSQPFNRAFAGVALKTEDRNFRTFRITEVLEDSPASEAGLREDDLIIQVDGRPASEFSISRLQDMFERPVSYKLTIRRGEQTMEVKLTPRRLV